MSTNDQNSSEWVLVPRTPTPEMLESAGTVDGYNWDGRATADRDHVAWWRDMLAAAPAPAALNRVEERHPVGGLDHGWRGEYNRGWNDCLATIRAADNRDAAGVRLRSFDSYMIEAEQRFPGINAKVDARFAELKAEIESTAAAVPAGEAVAREPFGWFVSSHKPGEGYQETFTRSPVMAELVRHGMTGAVDVTPLFDDPPPHPPAAEVGEAMIVRAEQAFARAQGRATAGRMYGNTSYEVYHEAMRAALTAARLPAAEVREVDGWTIERHTGRDGVPGVWAKNSDGSRVWIAALSPPGREDS